jgi:ornithine cyclodeaminase/alanine dehydrogenase-like protein (mu-crystallin family)
LADVTRGLAAPRASADQIVIFSPFGLGVLDLALSKMTLDLAQAADQGTIISSFLPNT